MNFSNKYTQIFTTWKSYCNFMKQNFMMPSKKMKEQNVSHSKAVVANFLHNPASPRNST